MVSGVTLFSLLNSSINRSDDDTKDVFRQLSDKIMTPPETVDALEYEFYESVAQTNNV